ncbi:lysozyme inhibitor LprI family protein [Paraburkholderia sp.]|uniref:lysozyme inhibitor LprI family protein n=1 Tax=Paraburkholderia sp. TaxID=1926495 RepID=UPI003D701FD4
MNRFSRWAATLVVLSGSGGTFAATAEAAATQPPRANCANPADQLTMNRCADLDFRAADHKLNDTYAQLTRRVTPQGQASLQKAERAWLAYRNAQCDFLTSAQTSYSAQPMLYSMCLARLTRAQTALLDEQLHCAEGDIGCGQQQK